MAPRWTATRCGLGGLALLALTLGGAANAAPTTHGEPSMLNLTSPDFSQGHDLPLELTCDGPGTSPALDWSGAPAKTQSFALLVDDPDAPGGTFTHWLLYDIAPDATSLPRGIEPGAAPDGARQGMNDYRRTGYGAPCPPEGRPHRYVHKLYALNTILPERDGLTRSEFERAIQGHVLASAELIGTYQKTR